MRKGFFNIEMDGLPELLKNLDAYVEEVKEETGLELEASAKTIAANAKRRVPKDTGSLANSISDRKIDDLTFEDVVQRHYGPYVEFGTGGLVDVPESWEDYASQFKGKGIKHVNLPARPFLFPSYEEERVKLIARLKAILKAE